jgi:hypothetical protein
VIGEPRQHGLPLADDRTIRTTPVHCPMAIAIWVPLVGFHSFYPTGSNTSKIAIISPSGAW